MIKSGGLYFMWHYLQPALSSPDYRLYRLDAINKDSIIIHAVHTCNECQKKGCQAINILPETS